MIAVNLTGSVLHVPGRAPAHDRARLGANHQHLLDHRRDRATSGRPNYAASKSGLFGLTKTPALEATFQLQACRQTRGGLDRRHQVSTRRARASSRPRCSTTSPRRCSTRSRGNIPVARLGRPGEIARVVHFLAADQSSLHHWRGVGGQRRHGHAPRPGVALPPAASIFRRDGQSFRGRTWGDHPSATRAG